VTRSRGVKGRRDCPGLCEGLCAASGVACKPVSLPPSPDAPPTLLPAGFEPVLQDMYANWPFFASTLDLVEMVLAKADAK
jgi:hypothetical protein